MRASRPTQLAPGDSYPVITLTVTVAGNAPSSVTNSAAVSSGGELNTANSTASDPVTIAPATATPIPVASPFALAVMAALLVVAGLAAMRRHA